jgi:acyl carrier protein
MDRNEIIQTIEHCLEENKIRFQEGVEIASLDLILLAVKLEKAIKARFPDFQFEIDEMNAIQFENVKTVADLVQQKITKAEQNNKS